MLKLEYIGINPVSVDKVYSVIYKCKKCPYITKSWFSISNHVKRHSLTLFHCMENKLESFICGDCAFSSQEAVTFRQHFRTHDVKKEYVEIGSWEQNGDTLDVINKMHESKDYYCKRFIESDLNKSECFLEINKPGLNHNRELHYQHAAVDDSRAYLQECMSSQDVKWFHCHMCSYKSKWRTNIDVHIRNKHTSPENIKWFHCDKCSYKCKWRGSLQSHITQQHAPSDEIKWFQCDHCSYKTKMKTNLQKHTLWKHASPENVRWFQCDHCSYKAKTNADLRKHMLRKHTTPENIKWFHCEHCSYKAKRNSDLHRHTLCKHTTSEDVEWFQCDFCSYKSKMKCHLQRHNLRRHTASENVIVSV